MNSSLLYAIQLTFTLASCVLLTAYLRPSLRRLLGDLCTSPQSAQFWIAFTNIILILVPLLFSLGYHPDSPASGQWLFELSRQMRTNLFGFVFSLLSIGMGIGFFALVAPRKHASD
jgi:hypothetical protein